MNYEMTIREKEEELAKLKAEAAKVKVNASTLKVGQCFKTAKGSYGETYHRLLYVDDSGYGYTLVIAEYFSLDKLGFFKGPDSYSRIDYPNRKVHFGIDQMYHFADELDHLILISEDEYTKVKTGILAYLANPKIPSNWVEAGERDPFSLNVPEESIEAKKP